MGFLGFLYWFAAYSIGLITIVLSVIFYKKNPAKENSSRILVLAGFACAVIPQSLIMLASVSGLLWEIQSSAFTVVIAVLALISQWGVCLLIFAVPKFVLSRLNSLQNEKRARILLFSFLSLAAVLSLDAALFLLPVPGPFGIISPWITTGIWVLFTASILYTLTLLLKKGSSLKEKKELLISLLFCAGGILLIVFQWIFVSSEYFSFIILPGFYLSIHIFILTFLIPSFLRVPSQDAKWNILKEKGISTREEEVIRLLIKGLSYKEIAGELFISLPTVQSHVGRIYRKTGVNSKIELKNLLAGED